MKLDVFRLFRKKKEFVPERVPMEPTLPEDLERFRITREPLPELGPPETPYRRIGEPMPPRPGLPPVGPAPEPEERGEYDKMDRVLDKLETIDTRLKLIEEKLRR